MVDKAVQSRRFFCGLAAAALLLCCQTSTAQARADCAAPVSIAWELADSYPHDPNAFTQGLVWQDGRLFESTGLRGQSQLRELQLETGEAIRARKLADDIFAEGLAWHDGKLYQLSWQAGRAWVSDPDTLAVQQEFRYSGEGWGLASDGMQLWMSDGSAYLRRIKPEDFSELGRLRVYLGKKELPRLNELEWIEGAIWANVWTTNQVVKIEPKTGCVLGFLQLRLLKQHDQMGLRRHDVLNGIAWLPKRQELLVTGKWWRRIYALKLDVSK